MSKKRDSIDFLEDAVNAMEKAEQFVAGISYDDFIRDDKTVFAVIRALEIVGEATKRIPVDIREQFTHSPMARYCGHERCFDS